MSCEVLIHNTAHTLWTCDHIIFAFISSSNLPIVCIAYTIIGTCVSCDSARLLAACWMHMQFLLMLWNAAVVSDWNIELISACISTQSIHTWMRLCVHIPTSHVTRSYKSCDSVIQVMWLVRVCITYSANCTCRQKSTENANPKVLTVKVRVTYSTSKIQLIKTSKHLRCDFVSTVVVTVWHGVVTSTQCVITCTARGHTGLSHEHVIKARWGKVVRVGPAGRRHKKGLKKCTQVKVT